MAKLFGPFNINSVTTDNCYAVVTSVAKHPTYAGFDVAGVAVYSDEENTKEVYISSGIIIDEVASESADETALRVLSTFKKSMATGMELI